MTTKKRKEYTYDQALEMMKQTPGLIMSWSPFPKHKVSYVARYWNGKYQEKERLGVEWYPCWPDTPYGYGKSDPWWVYQKPPATKKPKPVPKPEPAPVQPITPNDDLMNIWTPLSNTLLDALDEYIKAAVNEILKEKFSGN